MVSRLDRLLNRAAQPGVVLRVDAADQVHLSIEDDGDGAVALSHGNGLSGMALIEQLGTAPPDVVLSDMRRPRLDGLGLIRALAARALDIPVVLLGNSEGVIKTHCSAVVSKMGVRDRTQAVLRAIDLGWI